MHTEMAFCRNWTRETGKPRRMSWRGSLSGSLRSDSVTGGAERDADASEKSLARSSDASEGEEEEPIMPGTPSRGVKEDLSELTKTFGSKLWGVASFLAPPPSSRPPSSSSSPRIYSSADRSPSLHRQQQESIISSDGERLMAYESSRSFGIRSDFAEIGDSFKSGISRLSNSVAVNEISKIAFAFLPLREEEEEEEEEEEYKVESVNAVIGVTDEVLAFARNIACHPETWLDFPLLSEDEYFDDDFDMSEAQYDHALAIESLSPRLAALRIELCPTHMSIGCFWKIYFVLLHPRLNKHDSELLSTPQIVEARAMLMHGSQGQAKPESESSQEGVYSKNPNGVINSPGEQFATPRMQTSPTSLCVSADAFYSALKKSCELVKKSILTADAEFVDKSVIKEEPAPQMKIKEIIIDNFNEDDDWPEDEIEHMKVTGLAAFSIGDGEDISFSDLEEDDSPVFIKNAKSAENVAGSTN